MNADDIVAACLRLGGARVVFEGAGAFRIEPIAPGRGDPPGAPAVSPNERQRALLRQIGRLSGGKHWNVDLSAYMASRRWTRVRFNFKEFANDEGIRVSEKTIQRDFKGFRGAALVEWVRTPRGYVWKLTEQGWQIAAAEVRDRQLSRVASEGWVVESGDVRSLATQGPVRVQPVSTQSPNEIAQPSPAQPSPKKRTRRRTGGQCSNLQLLLADIEREEAKWTA